jgi:[ribosomal protein S18]-alanine N-acetyltransferase
VIRPGTPADLAEVAGLERDLFGEEAWSPTLLAPLLFGSGGTCMVAEDDGVVVGYAVASAAGDAIDLQRLGVRAEHRRHGVAHALVTETLAADERVLLEVRAGNAGAIAFYEAEGFAEIARRVRYYRDGSDAVVMERPGRGRIEA